MAWRARRRLQHQPGQEPARAAVVMSQAAAAVTPAAMPHPFGTARALRAQGGNPSLNPETPDTGSPSPALPRSMAGRAPLLRGRASSVFLVRAQTGRRSYFAGQLCLPKSAV